MNKILRVSFPVITIIRILCIAGFFIIPELRFRNIPDHGSFDLDLEIEWWQYLLGYMIIISFSYNSIISLLLSFKPRWIFNGFLTRKTMLRIFYIAELLAAPFFIYRVIEDINDTFFPSTSTESYLSDIFIALFPKEEVSNYEKLEVINVSILAFCSLLFILLFWRFYALRKRMLNS